MHIKDSIGWISTIDAGFNVKCIDNVNIDGP